MIMLTRIKFILYSLFNRNVEKKAEWIRKHNVFGGFGENNRFALFLIPADAKHVILHNNISVSTGTEFICHDTVNSLIRHMKEYKDVEGIQNLKNRFEPIEVMDNVFIGGKCIICPGVTIGPNAIVAAGAIVTKDVPEGSIVGGAPARVIGSFDEMVAKRLEEIGL